jgi:hypothetical protein
MLSDYFINMDGIKSRKIDNFIFINTKSDPSLKERTREANQESLIIIQKSLNSMTLRANRLGLEFIFWNLI